MTRFLYPRLAAQNIRRDRQFYLPYFLTVLGTAAAFYIVLALSQARLPELNRYAYLSAFMGIGVFVVALFAVIFLTYTNSFLAKRRQRELGLYNILGMGKGHIALVLGFETLYLALFGILGGVAAGAALQVAATWALGKLMHFSTHFSFSFSLPAAAVTAGLFGGILLFNLLLNLRRVHAARPVELLRSAQTGEREPRSRWLLALLGAVSLGSGYAIALFTRSAAEAVALYFLAVFLVIIGTYCLFTAVSIVVLKALRRSRRFYYQTSHFIGLSGMLYRMKRNAVGLANICILCTMVLVMISGTLTLYLGSEQQLPLRFPGEVTLTARADPLADDPLDPDALDARFAQTAAGWDYAPRRLGGFSDASLYLTPLGGGVFREDAAPAPGQAAACFYFLSRSDYESLTGVALPQDGKAHLSLPGVADDRLTLAFGDASLSYPVGAPLPTVPTVLTALVYVADSFCCAVLPDGALSDLAAARTQGLSLPLSVSYQSFWDVGGNPEAHQSHLDAMISGSDWTGVGSYRSLRLQSRYAYAQDYYSLNGGFFFLGVFLGLLFLMATVLIIYYKQLSEGYEDQSRFHIMRSVGLEERDIRRSINAQMLVVFFAPLLVSAVHIAFDFPLVARLLTLFGLTDAWLMFLCTLGTFGAFTLLYVLVYRLTARAYYRIVR